MTRQLTLRLEAHARESVSATRLDDQHQAGVRRVRIDQDTEDHHLVDRQAAHEQLRAGNRGVIYPFLNLVRYSCCDALSFSFLKDFELVL